MLLPRIKDQNEKPLEAPVPNGGGFAAIFRTVACVGDSLASGEFQVPDGNGGYSYHDVFPYSWGQFLGRLTGAKVYNFSRGGMTAQNYYTSFAESMGYWDPGLRAQAYIVALGVNDIFNCHQTVGTVSDYENGNKDTFAYYYAAILHRLKEISPYAHFFLVTTPKETVGEGIYHQPEALKQLRDLIADFAASFDRAHLLDLYTYAPAVDREFRANYYMEGHLNPAGYCLYGGIFASYIDYLVRQDPAAFNDIGLHL